MPHTPAALLSVAEAAERLGVSRVRAWQLVRAGRLPATRVGRGGYAVREADLAKLVVRPEGWPKGRKRGKRKKI